MEKNRNDFQRIRNKEKKREDSLNKKRKKMKIRNNAADNGIHN